MVYRSSKRSLRPFAPRDLTVILLCLIAVGLFSRVATRLVADEKVEEPKKPLKLYKVDRGLVTRTIRERGTIEPADVTYLTCKVKSSEQGKPAATVRWVIDNGAQVKKGDKLLELANPRLRDRLQEQAIAVKRQQSALTKAAAQLDLAQAKGKHDVAEAILRAKIAEQNLASLKSAHPLARKKLLTQRHKAETAVELAKAQAAKMQKAEKAKLMVLLAMQDVELAKLELEGHDQAHEGALAKAKTELALAQEKVALAKIAAAAGEAETQVQRDTAKAVYDAELAKHKELEEQVASLVLRAPRDGYVFYSELYSTARRSSGLPELGAEVLENQRLLYVTSLEHAQAKVHVHETMVAKLRKGQPATVHVDALKEPIQGQVSQIARSPTMAWFSDVRTFPITITLNEPPDGWRPGMSVVATIVAEQRKATLRVPLQAVVWDKAKSECTVKTARGLERRNVSIGMVGDRFLEIKKGLREGEQVLLNPWDVFASAPNGRSAPKTRQITVRSIPLPEDPLTFVTRYGLTNADYERLKQLSLVRDAVPMRVFYQHVQHHNNFTVAQTIGTLPNYHHVTGVKLAAGRFLADNDIEEKRNVAVLGASAAQKLFPTSDPIGKTVTFDNGNAARVGTPYRVVGVLAKQLAKGNKEVPVEPNDSVYLPLTTCNARFGPRIYFRERGARNAEEVQLHKIILTVDDAKHVRSTVASVDELLLRYHKKEDWDVSPKLRSD